MKVLVVGSGGREHALCWKLNKSPKVKEIYAAPGNAGTSMIAENVDIAVDDLKALKDFALKENIDLTIIGPELPLTLGIVDEFEAAGLKVFGPSKVAAELENSKAFSKAMMEKAGVPTAKYKEFTDITEAKAYAEDKETHGHPLVIKADGLAAGKGVFICTSLDEAFLAIDTIMKDKAFGSARDSLIIEDYLSGEEASFIAVTDGKTVLPFATSQDHKAIYDNDEGPNTGGMGAYSPAPVVTPALEETIMRKVMEPMVKAMADDGRPYKGILYGGIMIVDGKPLVLEFNCRFGDPECQPLLMRLKTDLVDVIEATIEERLSDISLEWDTRSALCVVMAAEGYPEEYEKGKAIEGLDKVECCEVFIFHAGTKLDGGKVVTNGGRVLGVTALGDSIKDAIDKAYHAVEKITWPGNHEDGGAYYRRDIGTKALR